MGRWIKGAISIVLSVVLVLIMATGVFADEATSETTISMDQKIADILRAQLDEEELAILQDSDLYNTSMNGREIADQPIISVYHVFWASASQPLTSMIEKGKEHDRQNDFRYYVVMDAEPYYLAYLGKRGMIGVTDPFENALPTYVSDILSLTEYVTLGGEESRIQGVYCFERVFNQYTREILVYLQTDRGVFVKYYEDLYAEGQSYAGDQFREYAAAYHTYLTADRFDEDGNLMVGDERFLEFIADGSIAAGQFQDDSVDIPKTNPFVLYGGIALGAVLLIGISAFFILRIRRKRNQN